MLRVELVSFGFYENNGAHMSFHSTHSSLFNLVRNSTKYDHLSFEKKEAALTIFENIKRSKVLNLSMQISFKFAFNLYGTIDNAFHEISHFSVYFFYIFHLFERDTLISRPFATPLIK